MQILDKSPIPPGGFTNFIQPHMSQNFHFVGGHAQFTTFKPPRTMEDTPSEEEIGTPLSSTKRNKYVTVDSGDDLELPRTEKRILWTQEEDVRLMSSWLHNSTDSSIGTDRKNEQYWYDVADTYNETTPSHRRRNAGSGRDHKNCKLRTVGIRSGGYGRNPKTRTWTQEQWQKKSKKEALEKKAKGKDIDQTELEELNTFGKIQADEHANRLKVLEVQKKLSSEKIERAKLAHLAAKEKKEAAKAQREARKLEVEARMFETYNRLLAIDVALMSDEDKLEHANTMKCLKKTLFSYYN
ncbi:uncharacterized protein LOC111258317 [Setaria italica]|uniref:uncharacterized protein LOC111258317 n=1 Tax=Setaria italica TaxID=4555 RepID=UPI000BE53D04|nr:uncharacterized protein LOC111258317 [Setaria italica]